MHICISQYGRQVAIYAFLTFSFLENPQLRKQRKDVDFLGFLRPKTVKLKKNDFWFQFYAHIRVGSKNKKPKTTCFRFRFSDHKKRSYSTEWNNGSN
jgi:hypothetical protein